MSCRMMIVSDKYNIYVLSREVCNIFFARQKIVDPPSK